MRYSGTIEINVFKDGEDTNESLYQLLVNHLGNYTEVDNIIDTKILKYVKDYFKGNFSEKINTSSIQYEVEETDSIVHIQSNIADNIVVPSIALPVSENTYTIIFKPMQVNINNQEGGKYYKRKTLRRKIMRRKTQRKRSSKRKTNRRRRN
jgi:hypothetical protein